MTTDKPVLRVGLLICSDLFFTSKVTGTAQALGLRVDAVDDIVSARLRLEAGDIGCVLLDLAAPRVSIVELVAAMPESARVPIIAFGSHVNVELLESARGRCRGHAAQSVLRDASEHLDTAFTSVIRAAVAAAYPCQRVFMNFSALVASVSSSVNIRRQILVAAARAGSDRPKASTTNQPS